MNRNNYNCISFILRNPQAVAVLNGSEQYPNIYGIVRFYTMENGTLVYADVSGLPYADNECSQEIFGFHIHEGESCTGNAEDSFADTGTHLDMDNCRHPFHTGDFPSLFGNNGKAVSVFLTNRFSVSEVIGKTIVIHGSPDDFITQPSGNSGKKIACGIIRPVRRI